MKSVLLILLSLLFASSLLAQDQIATLSDGSKVVLKANRTWAPYVGPKAVPSVMKSMAKVIPDDPRDTYSALTGLGTELKKSEFETEQQFLDRIYGLADKTRVPTAAGRRLSDTVLFVRGLARYDAEGQRFTFDVEPWLEFGELGTEVGKYRLALVTRRSSGSYQWGEPPLPVVDIPVLKMPAADARDVKPLLTVAVYGMPVDVAGNLILFVPKHFVVFNASTGEVYSETPFAHPLR